MRSGAEEDRIVSVYTRAEETPKREASGQSKQASPQVSGDDGVAGRHLQDGPTFSSSASESLVLSSCALCGAVFHRLFADLAEHLHRVHEGVRLSEYLDLDPKAAATEAALKRGLRCPHSGCGIQVGGGLQRLRQHLAEEHGQQRQLPQLMGAVAGQLGLDRCRRCGAGVDREAVVAAEKEGRVCCELKAEGEEEKSLSAGLGSNCNFTSAKGDLRSREETSEPILESDALSDHRLRMLAEVEVRVKQEPGEVKAEISEEAEKADISAKIRWWDGCTYTCPKCGEDSFPSLCSLVGHLSGRHYSWDADLSSLFHLKKCRSVERWTECKVCGLPQVHDEIELRYHVWVVHGLPLEAYKFL